MAKIFPTYHQGKRLNVPSLEFIETIHSERRARKNYEIINCPFFGVKDESNKVRCFEILEDAVCCPTNISDYRLCGRHRMLLKQKDKEN